MNDVNHDETPTRPHGEFPSGRRHAIWRLLGIGTAMSPKRGIAAAGCVSGDNSDYALKQPIADRCSRHAGATEPRETVTIKQFGAVGDGKNDDTAAIQAGLDYCETHKKLLFLPKGSYLITSTLFLRGASASMRGEGVGTELRASAFFGPVLEITTGAKWQLEWTSVDDLVISGNSTAPGQVGIRHVRGGSGLRMHRVYVKKVEIGFDLIGSQFCSFYELAATSCAIGLRLTQEEHGGGGNNDTFLDCWFSYNQVGVFLCQTSQYPQHNIKFINLTTHVNAVTAVYVERTMNVSIDNWAPEANGNGDARMHTIGRVVKNGILHAVGAQIVLRDYQHVSNDNELIAELNTQICIDGGGGATFRAKCDATSLIVFSEKPFRHYGNGGYLLKPPLYIRNGISSAFWTEPVLIETPTALNEAPGDVVRGQAAAGTTCDFFHAPDSQLGHVLTARFRGRSQRLVLRTAVSDYSGLGTDIAAALLLKCDSADARWYIDFGQSTAGSIVQLTADNWYRFVVTGMVRETTRSANLIVLPANAAAIAATLSVCRLHAFATNDARKLAVFVRDGLFNPNLQPAHMLDAVAGDEDLQLNLLTSAPVQCFQMPLSGNRVVNLPKIGETNCGSGTDACYRIVRASSATGDYHISVGGLKMLSTPSQWCEVRYSGVQWVLRASGAL